MQSAPDSSSVRFLSKAAVCQRYGCSPSSLDRAIRAKRFPPPVRLLGARRIGWSLAALDAYDAALAP
jgi:predicted DNA-binding transcriptional regulator AlpA